MTLTAAQQEIRATGIGASEIAAVAGLSPYAGPLDVWARKMGLVPPLTEQPEPMLWGNLLEDVIASEWARRAGLPGDRIARVDTLRHPDHPVVIATPDRIVEADGEHIVLEIKTAGIRQIHRWGESGTDAVPDEYAAQVTWQMATARAALGLDVRRAGIAVLLAGQEMRCYWVAWDPDLAADLISTGEDFWARYVETRTQPPPDGAAHAGEILSARFPRAGDSLLVAGTQAEIDVIERLRRAREAFAAAEAEKGAAEAGVKALIGDAAGIACGMGRVTWKNNRDRAAIDWEAVAVEAGATPDLITKHTTVKPGPRVLRCTLQEG